LLREKPDSLIMPRYFATERYGVPATVTWQAQRCPALVSTIRVKPDQQPIVDKAMEVFNTTGGGLLNLATGTGKTVIALELMCRLGVKTAIIVHKAFLLNQWIDRIHQFVPGASVGIVQGPKIDVAGRDVLLIMLQSVCQRDYAPGTFDGIGLLVVDESHHISAEKFCMALPKLATMHTLALSATPIRKDGLTRVFQWFLGAEIWKLERESRATLVKQVVYHDGDREYSAELKTYRGVIRLPNMINQIAAHAPRNALILHEVAQYLGDGPRHILLISERIAHLEYLRKTFDEMAVRVTRDGAERPATSSLYIGKMKQRDLDISVTQDVIFASTSMVREGLDIQTLNTLIIATPIGDVVQAAGRIMRQAHATSPLIIDVCDAFSIFHSQAAKRRKFYAKSKFVLHTAHFNAGDALSSLNTSVAQMQELADDVSNESDDEAPGGPPAFQSDTESD
jgi:superfamily II DNA or RNA helicase